MGQTILEMKNIKKSFGATQALKGINFQLELGEVHALLGENGAGKSTLIKVLGGIHQPDEGSIYINGKEAKMDSIQTAQDLGIGIIHQEIVLVPHLSIAENIFLGREPGKGLGFKDGKQIIRRAQEMVDALDLGYDVRMKVGDLNIAQQQMVEIVKAISFNAKILVMDEPTSSLSKEEVEKLFETIEKLKKNNVSIIYISHRMEELFRITDRITVIRDGAYVGVAETAKTTQDELVAMMVGRKLENYYIRDFCKTDEEVLRVEHLTKAGMFEDISFSVHKGEILGFAGLVGAGRSEVMTAIFGGHSFDSGKVILKGKEVKFSNTRQAIDSGISYVPEDRKKQGLVLINSVGYNITLASLKYFMKGFLINHRKRRSRIEESMKELTVKAASQDIAVSSLSGGNQQKVVLAKWLETKPELLILDEPTRGVDVSAKAEIYGIINRLAKEGMAIVMVSSELPEIINMCDSVCIMCAGKLAGRLEQGELSQENIMKYATGGVK